MFVDKDAYLLQLSRYIHRNPIDMKRRLVNVLEDYPWSSYPACIAKVKAPDWLHRETTYQMLGYKQRYKGYAAFVLKGVDEEIAQYYNRGNIATIIGDKNFKTWVYEELLPELESEEKGRTLLPDNSMGTIVREVAKLYHTQEGSIDCDKRTAKGGG